MNYYFTHVIYFLFLQSIGIEAAPTFNNKSRPVALSKSTDSNRLLSSSTKTSTPASRASSTSSLSLKMDEDDENVDQGGNWGDDCEFSD